LFSSIKKPAGGDTLPAFVPSARFKANALAGGRSIRRQTPPRVPLGQNKIFVKSPTADAWISGRNINKN
jgi:hypothetical protein